MNEMTNSHILVQEFEYLEPASVREAIALLSQYGDRARVLAGGTDLIVQMKMERLAPECLISIRKIPGLDEVVLQDGELRIGACTSIRAIRNAPRVRAHYPALAEACASFSTTQVQVMGTIGGNLCNGSPASDSAPVLIAFSAEAVIEGPDGERRLPLEEFFLGPGKTALREGELLTAVVLPTPPDLSPSPSPKRGGESAHSLTSSPKRGGESAHSLTSSPMGGIEGGKVGSAFIKISRVVADLAKASVAAVLAREGDCVVDCRLAFGSVGPTVMRARKAEAVLVGQPFSAELALEAGKVASDEITPTDDVRSNAWYRREVVKAITHDVLQVAWERASGCGSVGVWEQEARGREQEARGRKQEAGSETSRNTQHTTHNTHHEIELTVNGVEHRLWVKPNELLLNVLRERLELTGSKYGCGIGDCGACTVLLNGKPALSCLVLAIAADGSEVLTVEGLQGPDGGLDPLQEAFIEHSAFQCGYCTPGMLMTAKSLLSENPCPTEDEVRDYMKGNLCRCTGYASIVRAVMSCATAE